MGPVTRVALFYVIWTFVQVVTGLRMDHPGREREMFLIKYKNGRNIIPVNVRMDYRQRMEYVMNLSPLTNEKSLTMYDFNKRVIAYKDLLKKHCFISKMEFETINSEVSKLKKLQNEVIVNLRPVTLYANNKNIAPKALLNFAGSKIARFCHKMKTSLISSKPTTSLSSSRRKRNADGYLRQSYGHYGKQSQEYSHHGHETRETGKNYAPVYTEQTGHVAPGSVKSTSQYGTSGSYNPGHTGNNGARRHGLRAYQHGGYELNQPLGLPPIGVNEYGMKSEGSYGGGHGYSPVSPSDNGRRAPYLPPPGWPDSSDPNPSGAPTNGNVYKFPLEPNGSLARPYFPHGSRGTSSEPGHDRRGPSDARTRPGDNTGRNGDARTRPGDDTGRNGDTRRHDNGYGADRRGLTPPDHRRDYQPDPRASLGGADTRYDGRGDIPVDTDSARTRDATGGNGRVASGGNGRDASGGNGRVASGGNGRGVGFGNGRDASGGNGRGVGGGNGRDASGVIGRGPVGSEAVGATGAGTNGAGVASDTKVKTGRIGTNAEASSSGSIRGQRSQTQVQGAHAGNGTFSAQAQAGFISGNTQSQIRGGRDGGSSISSASVNDIGSAQSQVQVGTPDGVSSGMAQGTFTGGGTQAEAQGHQDGGSASAQSQSAGLSQSNAQVDARGELTRSEFFEGEVSANTRGSYGTGISSTNLQGNYGVAKKYAAGATGSFDAASRGTDFRNIVIPQSNISRTLGQPVPPPISGLPSYRSVTDYALPPLSNERDYGRPSGIDSGRPSPDYGRPAPDYGRPSPDYGRPSPAVDTARPSPDYGRPSPDYGRPSPAVDTARPSPDYGRPSPDYGRPSPAADTRRPSPDYGRPSPAVDTARPSPDYGRPSPALDTARPSPDYGRPSPAVDTARPSPDYGRPSPAVDTARPSPDYGRPSPDYGRPSPAVDTDSPGLDYGRPSPDYGRPSPAADKSRPSTDYGRPSPDYGRPSPDYDRASPDYGRPAPSSYDSKPTDKPRSRVSQPTDYERPTRVDDRYGRPTERPGIKVDDRIYSRPDDYDRYGRPATTSSTTPSPYQRPGYDPYGRPLPQSRPSTPEIKYESPYPGYPGVTVTLYPERPRAQVTTPTPPPYAPDRRPSYPSFDPRTAMTPSRPTQDPFYIEQRPQRPEPKSPYYPSQRPTPESTEPPSRAHPYYPSQRPTPGSTEPPSRSHPYYPSQRPTPESTEPPSYYPTSRPTQPASEIPYPRPAQPRPSVPAGAPGPSRCCNQGGCCSRPFFGCCNGASQPQIPPVGGDDSGDCEEVEVTCYTVYKTIGRARICQPGGSSCSK